MLAIASGASNTIAAILAFTKGHGPFVQASRLLVVLQAVLVRLLASSLLSKASLCLASGPAAACKLRLLAAKQCTASSWASTR